MKSSVTAPERPHSNAPLPEMKPAAKAGKRNFRRVLVLAHRYTGLALVVFLVVAGITGTFLTFYHELDAALNPRLFRAETVAADQPVDPFQIREKAEAALPDGMPVHWMPLSVKEGESFAIWVEPETPGGDDEYFFHPQTGELLGSRRWGDLTQDIGLNLMPFLYKLHYSLALGETGSLLFGIAALLWTIDCFVGAWLTFPVGAGKARAAGPLSRSREWARRWRVSWLIKGGSLFSSLFTFHRAAGLWIWTLLFVFAWSAVGFNLRSVYHPVMKHLLGTTDVNATLPKRTEPLDTPSLDWREAYTLAKASMAEISNLRGFEIDREGFLQYLPQNGLYRYAVHSSLDLGDRWAATRLWIDGNDGRLVAFDAPTGISAGNTISNWFFALHMGTVGGLPYRIFIALLGLLIPALAVSGVWIWWRKRRGGKSGIRE